MKTLNKKLAVLVVFLVASVAMAAAFVQVVAATQFFLGGINVSTGANYSESNKVTNIVSGSTNWSPGVLAAAGASGSCVDSPAVTLNGTVTMGDPCSLGIDRQAIDAGLINCSCDVVQGGASGKVHCCILSSGTSVLPDAGYRLSITSFR